MARHFVMLTASDAVTSYRQRGGCGGVGGGGYAETGSQHQMSQIAVSRVCVTQRPQDNIRCRKLLSAGCVSRRDRKTTSDVTNCCQQGVSRRDLKTASDVTNCCQQGVSRRDRKATSDVTNCCQQGVSRRDRKSASDVTNCCQQGVSRRDRKITSDVTNCRQQGACHVETGRQY